MFALIFSAILFFQFSTVHGINIKGFVLPLTRALGPSYFRFGGTVADFIVFNPNAFDPKVDLANASSVTLKAYQLDELYNFAKNSGWRFIFNLNLMLRSSDLQHWDPTNAKVFLDYSTQHGYSMDFELGNEPDGFPGATQFNVTINGTLIADDFKILRNLLNTYDLYNSSIIIGPSVAYYGDKNLGGQIVRDFLNNSGGNYIHGLTFHFYYFAGANANISNFLDHNEMERVTYEFANIKKLGYTPLWLGETASAYNGGAINMSDTYLDGFLWLDKLGLSALYGIDVVIRQELYSANYGLLNKNMHPNHDYWICFLYKKLIGVQVYNLTRDTQDLNLRLYAASSKKIPNAVVFYGVNVNNGSVTVDFPQFSTRQATVYILKESDPGNLQSWASNLNGKLLAWDTHQPGTSYQGVLTNLPIQLPELSQFFIVVEQNQETTCPAGWYKESTVPNKCLQFFNYSQPLFGAKFECTLFGNGSSILSIDNAFENAEILKASQTNGCGNFYIGLERNGTSFAWSNGDSSSFYNWKNGYPTSENTQNCVTFDATAGTWVNTDCDSFSCYICQKYI